MYAKHREIEYKDIIYHGNHPATTPIIDTMMRHWISGISNFVSLFRRLGPWGDVKLKLIEPRSEDRRQLFDHYVWNAAILKVELLAGDGRGSARNKPDWKEGGRWSLSQALVRGPAVHEWQVYSDLLC